jgi:hypothetical protein
MIPRLRTIAILMLAAGLSLGVFATKAISTWHLPFAADPKATSPVIEERVRFYQRRHNLDASATDLLRRELLRYDRQVMDAMWEFREQNDAWFRWAAAGAEERLQHILRTGMIPPPGMGLDGVAEPKMKFDPEWRRANVKRGEKDDGEKDD